jgi:antitoxin component YwqK of YwqJK toxin-antitoxin module
MIKCFIGSMILLAIYSGRALGQTQIFFTRSKKESDSIRNNTHYRILKVSDSLWEAGEYDLNDTLIDIGTYKDEKLQKPEGKFRIYNYIDPIKKISYDYIKHKADTTYVPGMNYLRTVGYFTNGKRTGTWYTYETQGKLVITEVFENDKLNGLYQSYNTETGKVLVEGNYINDLREGNWNMLSYNGDTTQTDIYKKGKIVKTISHLSEKKFKEKFTGGKPKYDFIAYLNRALADKKFDTPGIKTVFYSFIENTEGKLTEPSVISGSDRAINTAVIDAILAAPNWQPTYIDNQLTAVSVPFNFEITISESNHVARVSANQ